MSPSVGNFQPLSPAAARAALLDEARRFLCGDPQDGQDNIHPEWMRLLTGIATHMASDDLDTFTRWPTINQTMFIGDYPDTARQLAALQARADWRSRWEPALVESAVGAPWPSSLWPASSGNQIRQAYVLARFEDAVGSPIDAWDQVIELGGGFGALSLLVTRLGFRGRYVIVDNQPVRMLQRWYLAASGLELAPDGDLSRSTGVTTVATPALDAALRHGEVARTAFLANWSLSEAPVRFRDDVFLTLRRTQPGAIWVVYQKTFGADNTRYFASKLQDFPDAYESSVRPFQADAPRDGYEYGHGCLALKRVPGRSLPALARDPAPFETTAMLHLTAGELHGRIRHAIVTRTPFSAVRLGDGEARVMGFPKYVSRLLVADIWQTWFGRSDFTDGQLERVRDGLKRACLGADAVGVPQAEADLDSEFGRVNALLPREGFVVPETPLCHAGFHLRFARDGMYGALLEGVPRVGVVGPRDLRSVFPSLGLPEVVWLPVPPEIKFSDLPDSDREALVRSNHHLTSRFFDLMESELPRTLGRWPGLVVLVGAGILGKIYCQRVKALGGVAVDVGSMMDAWAGLKTRENRNFDGLRQVLR